MGGALLDGWLKSGIVSGVTVLDPAGLDDKYQNNPKIRHIRAAEALEGTFDVILLATKPQIMDQVCAALRGKIAPQTLILSIAAGKSIGYFEGYFGARHPVIRTMPNTPAAIGQGITVACPNAAVSNAQRDLATALLGAGGMVEWLADENLIDAVTALSGSGPAYVFHLIEILSATGAAIGLPADLAQKLARQTVIGSAALAGAEPQTPAAILRQNVTSPGGTTEAALKVLMDGRLEKIYAEALNAAKNRGKALNA